MDDMKHDDDNNNSASEETHEDIENVSFEKNSLKDTVNAGIVAYFEFLASLTDYIPQPTEEDLVKARERMELQEEFDELTKEARQDEKETWQSISKITSHTTVVVYIYNGTEETFKLNTSSWDNSVHPKEDYDIAPWQYESFKLSSETPARRSRRSNRPTQVKHGFSYKGGNLAFDFSTLLKIETPYDTWSFEPKSVPGRQHNIRSIGKAPLKCKSSITRSLDGAPYSYNVVIILG
ncbi:hypothetical protein ACYZUD_30850 [Pseudomonas sp. XS1P51]